MSGGECVVHLLPEDLWARIFNAWQTPARENVLTNRYEADADSVAADNMSMFQLLSTCCLFAGVFERNTGLFTCYYMKEGLPHAATVSLLSWLRKRGSYVHTLFSSFGSPTVDIVSGAVYVGLKPQSCTGLCYYFGSLPMPNSM